MLNKKISLHGMVLMHIFLVFVESFSFMFLKAFFAYLSKTFNILYYSSASKLLETATRAAGYKH